MRRAFCVNAVSSQWEPSLSSLKITITSVCLVLRSNLPTNAVLVKSKSYTVCDRIRYLKNTITVIQFTVHPKMTHSLIAPNQNVFFSKMDYKKRKLVKVSIQCTIAWKRTSSTLRFGMTLGWVNNDRISVLTHVNSQLFYVLVNWWLICMNSYTVSFVDL